SDPRAWQSSCISSLSYSESETLLNLSALSRCGANGTVYESFVGLRILSTVP
ncbi:hypothetical protein HispidOSU_014684, partial [Sigmodon hispidus]